MSDTLERGKFKTKRDETFTDVVLSNQMLGESGATGQMIHVEDLPPLVFEPGEPNPKKKTS